MAFGTPAFGPLSFKRAAGRETAASYKSRRDSRPARQASPGLSPPQGPIDVRGVLDEMPQLLLKPSDSTGALNSLAISYDLHGNGRGIRQQVAIGGAARVLPASASAMARAGTRPSNPQSSAERQTQRIHTSPSDSQLALGGRQGGHSSAHSRARSGDFEPGILSGRG